MAINEALMMAGATGIASVAPVGTAAPTTAVVALNAAFKDLGAISDDGLTEAFSETRQGFTPWGRTSPAKTVLTAATRTFGLTFWETNPDVLALYFKLGTAPTVTADALDFAENSAPTADYRSLVTDTIEGTNHVRIYVAKCEVTDRGNIVHKSDSVIGYPVTITSYGAIHRWYVLDALTP